MPGWNDTRRTFKTAGASATRRTERRHEPAGDDGTRSDAGTHAHSPNARSPTCWDCQSPRCARGGTEGRGRVSCGSGGRFATCRPTWRTSFGRAQLTRHRFPRLMVIRSSGSCRYESLETRSAGTGQTSPSPAVVTGSGSARRICERRRAENASSSKKLDTAGWQPTNKGRSGSRMRSTPTWTAKRMRCSPRTIELEEERLSLVKKHFGDVPLSAITATAIAEFQRTRHEAGIANRTINMDVGVLSRVLKSCGRWRALADHVQNSPRAPASGRPRTDARGTEAALRRRRVEPRVGARVLRRRSSPPTRRCGRSR